MLEGSSVMCRGMTDSDWSPGPLQDDCHCWPHNAIGHRIPTTWPRSSPGPRTAPTFQRHLLRVRPVEGLCHRRGPRRHPASRGWSESSLMCRRISLPERASSTLPTAGSGPRSGVERPPACASTARPSAARRRCSSSRSFLVWASSPVSPSTSRTGQSRSCTATSMCSLNYVSRAGSGLTSGRS